MMPGKLTDVPEVRRLLQAACDMPARRARMVVKAILDREAEIRARNDFEAPPPAFEADMEPVHEAIVLALEAGDMEALRGLRAMLPHLLAEVNAEPELAKELTAMIGREVVRGMMDSRGGAETRRDEALRSGNARRPFDPAKHPRGDAGKFATKGTSREFRSRGQDQFGHLPDKHGNIDREQNLDRGFRAIQFLQQPGQRIERAMFRKDVGWVGMEYGRPDHDNGWGNSHIESKHGREALLKVPMILQVGTLHPHDKKKKQTVYFSRR